MLPNPIPGAITLTPGDKEKLKLDARKYDINDPPGSCISVPSDVGEGFVAEAIPAGQRKQT